jgi:hypothetical protein
MPNHIQNRLQVIGSKKEVAKVLNAIKGEYKSGEPMAIDFNKILPMPTELSETTSDSWVMPIENQFSANTPMKKHLEELREFCKQHPDRAAETTANFFKAINNFLNYGHATWYNWSVENWGTKWNAYGQELIRNTEDTLYFKTAWSAPVDLIKKLSGLFPNVELQLTYADEDTGSNTGRVRFKDGEMVWGTFPGSCTKEGYDIAFELNPDIEQHYQWNGETYEYKDEE